MLLALAACGGPRRATVRVLVPDLEGIETPIPGVVVVALPYDRDSVLGTLERRAGTERPNTAALDSLFHAFRVPFLAFAGTAWRLERITRARDSLAAHRGAAAPPPGSPGTAELDARLRAANDSIARLAAELERARAALAAARDTLWPRMERLRAETRRWEASTYAGYDTIVRTLTRDRLQEGLADTTDAAGWTSFRLRQAATWWVTARSPDPQDPNFEWYWNVRLAGDTLLLRPANGRHRPRY